MRVHVLGQCAARRAYLSALVASLPGCEVLESIGALDSPIRPDVDAFLIAIDSESPAAAGTISRLRDAHPYAILVVVGTTLSPDAHTSNHAIGADASVDDHDAPETLRRLLAMPGAGVTTSAPSNVAFTGAAATVVKGSRGSQQGPAEADLDGVLLLAAELFDAQTAVLNLVGATCTWCHSLVSCEVGATPDGCPFCPYTIEQASLLVVPNAAADLRFCDSPSVVGPPHIRFFAGAPLMNHRGEVIGALCVLDTEPHSTLGAEAETLPLLANDLVMLSTMRARSRRLAAEATVPERINDEGPTALAKHETLLRFIEGVVFEVDPDTLEMCHVSDSIEGLFGYRRSWWLSQPHFWRSLLVDEDRATALAAARRCAASGQDEPIDIVILDSRGQAIALRGRIQCIVAAQDNRRLRFVLVAMDVRSGTRGSGLETRR